MYSALINIAIQFIISTAQTMVSNWIGYSIFFIWLILFWPIYKLFNNLIKKEAIDKARFFVIYLIVTILVTLFTIGKHFISDEYFANIVSEVFGMLLTVVIIDRVNSYLSNRDEKLYRDIALRNCKMPIFTYCYTWLAIYEPNSRTRAMKLAQYQNIEDFFLSDDFYNTIARFNFARPFGTKTYAQYYLEKIEKTEADFQNILAKYASKVSTEDIRMLEFFGGTAYIYNVFRLMNVMRTVVITTSINGVAQPPHAVAHINEFSNITKANFQKHFRKLLLLIAEYNSVAHQSEHWTIATLNTLTTLNGPNADDHNW